MLSLRCAQPYFQKTVEELIDADRSVQQPSTLYLQSQLRTVCHSLPWWVCALCKNSVDQKSPYATKERLSNFKRVS